MITNLSFGFWGGWVGVGNIWGTSSVIQVKSSYIQEGEQEMKRILFIILAVIAVFLVIGFSLSIMLSSRTATFSNASRELGYGGGAPQGIPPFMEMPAATMAPATEAPAPALDAYAANESGQAVANGSTVA